MMAALALLAAAATPPPPPPAEEAAIVVLGRKLKTWRGKISQHGDGSRCVTKQSSGDRQIDEIGCDTMEACFRPIWTDFIALAKARLPKTDKQRQVNALVQTTLPCMKREREARLALLADQRAGAGQ